MSYFIKIEDAPEVRRKVLESSKASIHILKGYQELLVIRSEKLGLMNQLRRDLKEITLLMNRAEALMPVLDDAEIKQFVPQELPKLEPRTKLKPKRSDQQIEQKPVQQAISEKERLEIALQRLEERLGNI